MSDEIAARATVVGLVSAFQATAATIRAGFAAIDASLADLNRVFGNKPDTHRVFYLRGGYHHHSVSVTPESAEDTIKKLERDAWSTLVDRLELRRFMSVDAYDKLQEQLRSGELPPITLESVADFAEGFRAAAPDMHKDAVREVFEWLRPRATDRVHRLKTNTELEVGRRVENVFRGFDGRGTTAKTHTSEIQDALHASKDGRGETWLVKFRACHNGNLHLEFKRLDLLARLNREAGGKRLKPEAPGAPSRRPPAGPGAWPAGCLLPPRREARQGAFPGQDEASELG